MRFRTDASTRDAVPRDPSGMARTDWLTATRPDPDPKTEQPELEVHDPTIVRDRMLELELEPDPAPVQVRPVSERRLQTVVGVPERLELDDSAWPRSNSSLGPDRTRFAPKLDEKPPLPVESTPKTVQNRPKPFAPPPEVPWPAPEIPRLRWYEPPRSSLWPSSVGWPTMLYLASIVLMSIGGYLLGGMRAAREPPPLEPGVFDCAPAPSFESLDAFR